jgi:MFS transporter, DHA3 family, macrolide efflux protein
VVFIIIWFGQLISLVGSGLTGFALSVWVFQRTGSTTQFALLYLSTMLPGILMSPFAGTYVDRWDRRKAMLLSDAGAGLSTLAIALLFFTGRLDIWIIYLALMVRSVFNAFRWPALSAITTLTVPKQHLGRASGVMQFGEATAQIVSPLLAGLLLSIIQIQGIVFIDFITFLFALFSLLIVRVPKPQITEGSRAVKGSLLRESAYGWIYVRQRPGLLALMILFTLNNFCLGIVMVMFTPLVLGFASAKVLGTVLSISGAGMLIGSLAMSVWGGPKRRIYGILPFMLLQGTILFMGGLKPNFPLVACAAFMFLFLYPIIVGSNQAIWQTKVATDAQGRVFAVRRMIAMSTLPLAYLIAGPLADKVFEPLLAVGGPLAGSVGRIIGVGPGRGIGLLFIFLGFFTVLTTAAAYFFPRLRMVEEELPDAITDKPAAEPQIL